MLEHGGHLLDAAKKYSIAKEQWLDLSTGINPNGWPIPEIPVECWQRLPETSDGLEDAAKAYYQCQCLLPVAGSQAAIQTLPLLRKKSTVGVLSPAYAEHAHNWEKAGHSIKIVSAESLDDEIAQLDVLILINPNNPSAQSFSKLQLLAWHQQLRQRSGWLIVDEAFADGIANNSLATHPPTEGLIILRSIGKFFGLAGIRCGFVIAEQKILDELNEILGPWTLSHPSRYIATAALKDTLWQTQTREALKQQSRRLTVLLNNYGLIHSAQTDLFVWVNTSEAEQVHHALAEQAVLTRLFKEPLSLRFGLPKNETEWTYLDQVLSKLNLIISPEQGKKTKPKGADSNHHLS